MTTASGISHAKRFRPLQPLPNGCAMKMQINEITERNKWKEDFFNI